MCIILFFIVALLINQPDLGQTLLLVASWITMIFVSGFNIFLLTILSFIVIVAFTLLIYFFSSKFGYVISRIHTFFNPSAGDNFQSQKALDAIKQGGLTGQGMGEGILKDKVPEAHTDYIIAVISEEFGALFVLFFSDSFGINDQEINNVVLIAIALLVSQGIADGKSCSK